MHIYMIVYIGLLGIHVHVHNFRRLELHYVTLDVQLRFVEFAKQRSFQSFLVQHQVFKKC